MFRIILACKLEMKNEAVISYLGIQEKTIKLKHEITKGLIRKNNTVKFIPAGSHFALMELFLGFIISVVHNTDG